jgi:hypothetical protein
MGKQSVICVLCLILILINFTNCAKEYSFEGGATPPIPSQPDTSGGQDSSTTPGITLPTCRGCELTDTSSSGKWSFKIGGSSLCGFITNAVASPDKTAMTFFGPSACSVDSGLIITAYFNTPVLSNNQTNLTAASAALEYYDNTTLSDVFKSKPPNILSVTINSYDHQTGITDGTFAGSVVNKNGATIKVDAGKFKIKL